MRTRFLYVFTLTTLAIGALAAGCEEDESCACCTGGAGAGCGAGPGGGPGSGGGAGGGTPTELGSCVTSSEDVELCIEYIGDAWTAAEVEGCGAAPNAEYDPFPCTDSGLTGTCTVPNEAAGPDREYVVFYYPPTTPDVAQAACGGLGGEFVSGN